MRKLAFFALSVILMLIAGCAPECLIGPTSESMDTTVFEVMSNEDRTSFDSFDENPPISMLVRYDQIYPDVTVTDTDLMRKMYDAITKLRITAKTNAGKTDGYHCVLFTTADGKSYGLRFEHDLLNVDNTHYELKNAEEFWALFKQIATDCYENNNLPTGAS